MANNFNSLKSDNSTSKIYFVRINPGRDITDSLTIFGTDLYGCFLEGLKVNKILLNGQELTKVDNPTSNLEFSFNEANGEVRVFSDEVPGDEFVFIAFHYLFFTNDFFRYQYQDPEDVSTKLREWSPRLNGNPNFAQSIENIIQGTLSISSKSISLKNTDAFIQKHLSYADSFYNKPIEIWQALNHKDNIKKIFEGLMTDLSIGNEAVSISVEDILSRLSQNATYGTPSEFLTFRNSAKTGWVVAPERTSKVVPLLIGEFTKYNLLNAGNANLPEARKLDPESLLEATCISYNATLSGTVNRNWGMCLSIKDLPAPSTNVGFITVDNTDSLYTKVNYTFASTAMFDFFAIGDIATYQSLGVQKTLLILFVDYPTKTLYVEKDAALDASWFYEQETHGATAFIEKEGIFYPIRKYIHFTVVSSTVPDIGGQSNKYFFTLRLNDDIETALGIDPIDPINDKITFRLRAGKIKHGEILSKTLIASGIKVNQASFDQTDVDLPVNCNFTVPYFDESEVRPYFGYIEDILKSTLGYLALNNDFEIEYRLFSAPAASTSITESNIARGSFSVELKYKDIATEIIAYNPHMSAEDIISKDPTITPSKTLKNNRSIFLHQVDNTDQFRHVVDNIVPTLQKILSIRSQRRLNYVMSTESINNDTKIGDQFKVDHRQSLSEFVDSLVVVSIDDENIILSDIPL